MVDSTLPLPYPPLTGTDPLLFVTFSAEITDPEVLQDYARLLTAEETARRARFHFPSDQQLFLISRALLRTVLAHYVGQRAHELEFVTGSHGKPALRDHPQLAFNLSHCKGSVALAISRADAIGVDIEGVWHPRGDFLSIAEGSFSPTEIAQLKALPLHLQLPRFVDLWTLKESYIKGIGLGLSKPLTDCVFRFDDDGLRFSDLQPADATKAWGFALLELADSYRAALAAPAFSPEALRLYQVVPGRSLSPLATRFVSFSRST